MHVTYIAMLLYVTVCCGMEIHYHIVGKFSEGKVWRVCSFQAFGKKKFDEFIDQPKGC